MTVFLDGIAAQYYRGIGEDVQYISPFSRVNFFIGANNSGKSIVLNLISKHLVQYESGKKFASLEQHEIYRGKTTGEFMWAIGRNVDELVESIRNDHFRSSFQPRFRMTPDGEPITLSSELKAIFTNQLNSDFVWVTHVSHRSMRFQPVVDIQQASKWTDEWSAIWHSLTGKSSGGLMEHWIPETLSFLAEKAAPDFPEIHLIPAKRILGGKEETFDDLSGKGLIDHLATLQNPAWNKQENREKFQKINNFLREVIGKPDVTLEVPSGREHLLVHMDNKVLPLSSLGTGIHEVILIAAFCTIHDGSIMCIEEPEIHLHPLLQRKLVSYLIDNTSSQYFIATHSSVFIDTIGANVFHVVNDGEQTRIKSIITRIEQREILDGLGSQASDILQANAVIWVEGPSDRIYLNHWIKAVDGRLKEGVHYTIMFYGGGLISHLTAMDGALDEFIKLRDLNRNMAMVIDSDRCSVSAPLKRHAQRIYDEMSADGTMVWVTAGREIENYVDGEKLQAALKETHSKLYCASCEVGQFDHAFYFLRENPERAGDLIPYKHGDKVGVAVRICSMEAQLDILDLRTRLDELTRMIRKANGLN